MKIPFHIQLNTALFFLKVLSIRILVSSSVLANRKQTVSSLHADNPTLLLGGKLFKTYVSSCWETLKLSYMLFLSFLCGKGPGVFIFILILHISYLLTN